MDGEGTLIDNTPFADVTANDAPAMFNFDHGCNSFSIRKTISHGPVALGEASTALANSGPSGEVTEVDASDQIVRRYTAG